MSINVTNSNFETEVLNSSIPVIADFWASWCAPCRMQSAVIDEVSPQLVQKAKIVKINVDEEPELAEKFNVMSVPTLIVFKNGAPVKTYMGFKNKNEFINLI